MKIKNKNKIDILLHFQINCDVNKGSIKTLNYKFRC